MVSHYNTARLQGVKEGKMAVSASFDLEDEFELDGHVEGKFGGAEGEPRMASRLSENLDEEIRGAVDHGRLLGESLSGRHVAGHPHDPHHAVESTQFLANHGQGVQESQAGRVIALLRREVLAQL